MSFGIKDLEHIAKLARLHLEEADKQRFCVEINNIVGFADQLKQVNVENVEPLSHTGEQSLLTSDDYVHDVVGRRCFESSAGYDEGLVRVPKIIE